MLETKQDFLGLEKGHVYEQKNEGKDIVFTDIDNSKRVRVSSDRLWRVSDLFDEIEGTDGM